MRGIFNYDGWLMQGLSKIADAIALGVLWVVFSLPIITMGASTTALYYTVHKVFRKNNGTVWASFWHGFKSNFKQATVLFVIIAIVGTLVFFSLYYGYSMYLAGAIAGLFMILLGLFDVVVLSWMSYLLPYASRFNASTKEILKNSGAIAFMNLGKSILLVAILLISGFLALNIPFMLVLMPVMSTWVTSCILEKIFRKYMTPEALAAEDANEETT